ncbi:MAG: S8 family serine peptidase [Candidatus Thermoplasmatota archaeon]
MKKVCVILFSFILISISFNCIIGYNSKNEKFHVELQTKKIKPSFERSLSDFTEHELIVQFKGKINSEDIKFVLDNGFKIKRKFDVLPALHLLGKKNSIEKLMKYDRTLWIEQNSKINFYMDESTTTINATKVWYSKLLKKDGEEEKGIDGTGITAAIVDTGIDAGHPDLDYGKKVILNLKSDINGTYSEAVNTDTGSGHGTHVAGTIAGNGDASGGTRRGVAPGATLIGISTGEALLTNVMGALEWVYLNSRENANPYNIRVVSNSWGTSGEYNPEDAIVKITQKLTYENNVVVVFAAGNDGEENHDGSKVTTNPYSITPSVISVAALERNGSGIAYFSSRGKYDENFTWPDIGAPGVKIWATEARKTMITAEIKLLNPDDALDGYYMAISGTSMATPHVSGLVTLLFQACPSLKVSEVHDDYSGNETSYWNDTNTRVHEVELILKATATYINKSGDNGVPDNSTIGYANKKNDFAQGYGLVDAQKAVALAITLNELRKKDANAKVEDAIKKYFNITTLEIKRKKTDRIFAQWKGDWSRLNSGDSYIMTKHNRKLYIPNESKKMIIDFSYSPVSFKERSIVELSVIIDYNGDGSIDWKSSERVSRTGTKHDEIEIESGEKNKFWEINVVGNVIHLPRIKLPNIMDNEFNEAIISYTMSIQLVFETRENETIKINNSDYHSKIVQFEFGEGGEGYIEMPQVCYNLTRIVEEKKIEKPKEKKFEFPYWALIIFLIFIAIIIGRKKLVGIIRKIFG